MAPVRMRMTYRGMEVAVGIILLGFAGLILYDALRLGPGWGPQGPRPGFFPFSLTLMLTIGAVGVILTAFLKPDPRPFFEARQEIEDLLKVGVPVFFAVLAIRWLGIYATSGLYLAFFMAWYGRFRWYSALAGGILLPVVLWVLLHRGFNIPMPMSMFYRQGILPF